MMKSRKYVVHTRGPRRVQWVDAEHNLCPWCEKPYDKRLPIICHHGCDWAYGHLTEDNVMTMHFNLVMTGGEDPDVMEISDDKDYLYQKGHWDYSDVFEGGDDEC